MRFQRRLGTFLVAATFAIAISMGFASPQASNNAAVRADGASSVAATPATHATSHNVGGADAVTIKLDDLATPDDNTDLNASTTRHGLLPKLSNSASDFLTGIGTWATVAGGDPDTILGPSGSGGGRVGWLMSQIAPGGGADDEFDTTDAADPMTGWTTIGTPTAHDMNTSPLSHYHVKRNATTTNWTGIYKAWSPSNGATVTAKLSAAVMSATSHPRVGALFIGEATPGKILSLSPVWSSGSFTFKVDSWTSPTAFSSTPATTAGIVPELLFLNEMAGVPYYLRIIYNSSTSITYQISNSGIIWYTVVAANDPGFTVGAVGVGVEPEGQNVEAWFDWIRFTP